MGGDRSDPRPMLAIVAAAVLFALWRLISSIDPGRLLSASLSLAPLALGAVAIASALATHRILATRRTLRSRRAVAIVPADCFDAEPEAVLRFAAQLADTERLRRSERVRVLLGQSRSTYRVREAMDCGKVVLACPGAGGTRDRLVANPLLFDLLHAARRRADLPPAARKPFWVFLDEVQSYDGAASGNLAALCSW